MPSLFRILLLGAFFPTMVHARHIDSLRIEKDKGSWYVVHEVDEGETLFALSQRYKTEIVFITQENSLATNQISMGQELRIPVTREFAKQKVTPSTTNEPQEVVSNDVQLKGSGPVKRSHTVEPKETLFSISKLYGISVEELINWNDLQGTGLSIGQKLIVDQTVYLEGRVAPADQGFTEYYVQNGDILETIAAKYAVRPDSIVIWNDLDNTYLSIGQKLRIRGELDSLAQTKEANVVKLPYGTRKKNIDQSGFVKVFEEGIAKKIDTEVISDKALALHRDLNIGAMLEVRNLMNNKKILVKVVGKLPETGLNQNTLIRLTPVSFKRLGIIDPQARVEVTYYE